MKTKELRAGALLLLTAAIWGFAMAAQREASRYLSPYTFNGLRFILGAVVLAPLMAREDHRLHTPLSRHELFMGAVIGVVLFLASLCQQIGVKDTGAGKSGFLTALYVVLVPLFGMFLHNRTSLVTWISLGLALPALYLLCVPAGEAFSIAGSDLWVLLGAVLWALHILFTDRFIPRTTALKLCVTQFSVAAVLNLIFALLLEPIDFSAMGQAFIPVVYCGVFSTGVGYLLQTLGQKDAKPAHAALILSMESVFCVIAGALLLNEKMDARGYAGCALMLLAVLLSQLGMLRAGRKKT